MRASRQARWFRSEQRPQRNAKVTPWSSQGARRPDVIEGEMVPLTRARYRPHRKVRPGWAIIRCLPPMGSCTVGFRLIVRVFGS